MARLRIGELLVEAKVITPAQVEEALRAQREGRQLRPGQQQEEAESPKLGQILVDQGLITETQLTQTLSLQLSVPWVSLYHIDFSRQLLNMVPRELAERFSAVPIFVRNVKKQGNSLYVAMDDPTNEVALAEIAKAAGLPVKPMIACLTDIRNAIRVYYVDSAEMPAAAPVATATATATATAPPPARAPVPPRPPPRAQAHAGPPRTPPPAPFTGRAPLPTLVDSAELVAQRMHLEPPPSTERAPAPEDGASDDSPDAAPELEVGEYTPSSRAGRARPRMVSLTLLDGTTLNLPEGRSSAPPPEGRISPVPPSKPRAPSMIEPLTARDLVSALRAVAHGADASEVLGNTDWEAMFAALLSLLLKKNLIADWEYVEELRNI